MSVPAAAPIKPKHVRPGSPELRLIQSWNYPPEPFYIAQMRRFLDHEIPHRLVFPSPGEGSTRTTLWVYWTPRLGMRLSGSAPLGGGIGIVLIALASGAADGPQPPSEVDLARRPFYWLIGPFAVAWCGVIGYGAWEMDRLGNYRAAVLAAWMAVVPVPIPLYLLWMVGAVLGIVALNDRAVRAAFASGNGDAREQYLAANPYRPPRPRRRRPRGAAEDPPDLD